MPELGFYRGSDLTYPCKVSKAIWTAGGSLLFAAKTTSDNTTDDSTAVLKKTLTDSDITSEDANYKIYSLVIAAADTLSKTAGEYIGQFKYINASGKATVYETFTFRIEGDIVHRTS